jgi:uncharacterized protein
LSCLDIFWVGHRTIIHHTTTCTSQNFFLQAARWLLMETAMNNQENKQLVMQAYQMFKNKDIQGLLALNADDIEWIGNESEYLPFAGTYRGKDQVAKFFNHLDQAQEVIQFEPQIFVAEDDKVVVTGQSIWLVKSTGQRYGNPWVHVFTIRDGKIARFQQYNHTAAAEAAFRPSQTSPQQTDAPMHH